VVRNFDQGQFGHTEKLRLGARQLHEYGLAQCDRRPTLLLQFDGVVDTPRCARASRA
jgi:hypothetical protein